MLRRMVDEMSVHGRDPPAVDPAVWAGVADKLRAELATDDVHLVLLATLDAGPPVGLLSARVEAPPAVFVAKRLLHVSAVFVEPSRRGQGIGRRLLDEALAWGRTRACVEASLNVLVANPARQLYFELGFADVRVEMRRGL